MATAVARPLATAGLAAIGLAAAWLAAPDGAAAQAAGRDADRLMIVDCLLPGQVRQLGSQLTYVAARRAIKTTAGDCEIRGGEYVAHDRASAAQSLKAWLPLAREGDAEAQTYVGEIFEKGIGGRPDHAAAAEWYLKAAEQGFPRAMLNLGNMFEQGLGFAADPDLAREWYRKAAGIDGLSFAATDDAPQAAPEPSATGPGPEITIIEPELAKTRGRLQAKLRGGLPQRLVVVGQVQSDVPVASVILNGQEATMIGERVFRVELVNVRDAGDVRVVAIDRDGRQSNLEFGLGQGDVGSADSATPLAQGPIGTPVDAASGAGGDGVAHALVIGNNRYPALTNLDTAVADARAVASVLEKQYGFSVSLLVDADRYAVLSALNDLRQKFGPNDRLLVYYAGHGELDRVNERGHWLPVDAEPDNPTNWISNVSVTDMLNVIPARQLMVIADSCYAGMMSRSALGTVDPTVGPEERLRLLRALAGARTRTALTSGGVAPVIDTLDGRHSVFANALLDVLRRNRGALTGLELFEAVRPHVVQAAELAGFSQIPEYAPLKFAGHEAGDFLFVRRNPG